MKANETAEEKRLRRLRKKQEKELRRKEQMGWDKEYMHYTNTDNPFGDANLLSTFVWEKKLSKEGLIDADKEELERLNRQKMEDNKRELEKVREFSLDYVCKYLVNNNKFETDAIGEEETARTGIGTSKARGGIVSVSKNEGSCPVSRMATTRRQISSRTSEATFSDSYSGWTR